MPSTITHAFMAKKIYKNLNGEVKKVLKNEKDYIIYSQGFDILFFYRILFPIGNSLHIQKLGGIAHKKEVNSFFISLVEFIKKTKDADQFTFLAGLVTHYIGDTTCHPLVNYLAYQEEQRMHKKKDYHFLIETYIDNYIVSKKGFNHKKFKGYQFLHSTRKKQQVINLLDNAFFEVYQEKNIGSIYYRSLKHMYWFFRFLRYDPLKIKRLIYQFLYLFCCFIKRDIRYLSYYFNLEKDLNVRYLNLDHRSWYNIKNKEIKFKKSFPDLYEDVITKSQQMIQELYDYIYRNKDLDLSTFFGNLSYANGLPIK